MKKLVEQYLDYASIERGFSPRTIHAYRHDLNKFTEFFSTTSSQAIEEVKKDDIRRFLSKLAESGYKSPNTEITRSRKLSSIKSFFGYLVHEGVIKANPASDIKSPKIPEREATYLTKDEYEKLIATVKKSTTPYYQYRDLAVTILFLGTGIRLCELVGMNLESIDLDQRIIKVKGKGNKERIIPLNKEVVDTMGKYLENRPQIAIKSLFLSRRGNCLSAGSVYHLIKNYLKKAGISKSKVGVHSLRHTFGASLLSAGANLVVIQELLGHKQLETTRRYLHINNMDLRNAVESLSLSYKQ